MPLSPLWLPKPLSASGWTSRTLIAMPAADHDDYHHHHLHHLKDSNQLPLTSPPDSQRTSTVPVTRVSYLIANSYFDFFRFWFLVWVLILCHFASLHALISMTKMTMIDFDLPPCEDPSVDEQVLHTCDVQLKYNHCNFFIIIAELWCWISVEKNRKRSIKSWFSLERESRI